MCGERAPERKHTCWLPANWLFLFLTTSLFFAPSPVCLCLHLGIAPHPRLLPLLLLSFINSFMLSPLYMYRAVLVCWVDHNSGLQHLAFALNCLSLLYLVFSSALSYCHLRVLPPKVMTSANIALISWFL